MFFQGGLPPFARGGLLHFLSVADAPLRSGIGSMRIGLPPNRSIMWQIEALT